MAEQRALWVSTSTTTRGGIATYVRAVEQSSLWASWNIRHVATHRDGSKLVKLTAFVRGATLFVFELIRFRPNVVHLHASADASFLRKGFLSWVATKACVPVVIHMHGSNFSDYYEGSPPRMQLVIRSVLARASAVVALGDAWANRIRAIAPDARITVIPNAIAPARHNPRPGPNEPVHVAFLGRIGDRKGTFRLLDAWALLDRSDAKLTIAGDGEVDRARERIAELGLEDTVQLHGWLSQDDAGELLDRAHVLVLPSHNEGQPMAVLEAMARGLCVVASDVGGLGEMIGGGCGAIIPPDDVDTIAATLRGVIDDPSLRTRYGDDAYARFKERYDIGAVSRQLEALYSEVAR